MYYPAKLAHVSRTNSVFKVSFVSETSLRVRLKAWEVGGRASAIKITGVLLASCREGDMTADGVVAVPFGGLLLYQDKNYYL